MLQLFLEQLLGLAATWVRGFVNNFLIVPFACLGSREAAIQLWNSQKHFPKLLTQVAARPSSGLNVYKNIFPRPRLRDIGSWFLVAELMQPYRLSFDNP